ncbi:MAG: DUF6577 family protein [Candidatus Cloacimonadota bacterium]|nr:DUF6577 family protein [Candidatus Cloacimonadota bacterium]
MEVKTKIELIIKAIRDRFSNRESISRDELFNLYKEYQPDIIEPTFAWNIYNLKKKKIIFPISRGIYSLKAKPKFQPDVSDKMKRIFMSVKRKNLSDNLSIWDSSWLSEFMIHQPMKNVITLETDADVLETVYYHIKDNEYKKVFMKPDEKQMEQYVMEEQEPVILLPYVSRSPVKEYSKIIIPKLEKILVDLFLGFKLFYWVQGQELKNIFDEVHRRYQINYTTLIAYAKRRGADKRLKEFIVHETDIPKDMFYD